jgi:plasmid stability protein
MAQILIRGLSEQTVARWKARAKANGRSLQAEIKEFLEQEARLDPLAARRLVERLQKSWGDRVFSDSTPIIRAMRDSDDRAA